MRKKKENKAGKKEGRKQKMKERGREEERREERKLFTGKNKLYKHLNNLQLYPKLHVDL